MTTLESFAPDDIHAGVTLMERTGGHFAHNIARAWFYADMGNQRRLWSAFNDLFVWFIEQAKEQ